MAKIGKQKKITVEGIDYTLQHPGSEAWLEIQDRIQTGNGMVSNKQMAKEIFTHVIVEPKVNFAHFDENEGLEEVMNEATSFLRTGK
ncbi:hypothetical protein ABEI56_05630 [Peribacillus castrilensis]|uniref:hypothetical protein n=1 Tax=Peribacillus castrilensis TaxID=2897690 RepID=UPI003D280E20